MTVHDIATQRFVTIGPARDAVAGAARQMEQHQLDHIPVVDVERLAGIVLEANILCRV